MVEISNPLNPDMLPVSKHRLLDFTWASLYLKQLIATGFPIMAQSSRDFVRRLTTIWCEIRKLSTRYFMNTMLYFSEFSFT